MYILTKLNYYFGGQVAGQFFELSQIVIQTNAVFEFQLVLLLGMSRCFNRYVAFFQSMPYFQLCPFHLVLLYDKHNKGRPVFPAAKAAFCRRVS